MTWNSDKTLCRLRRWVLGILCIIEFTSATLHNPSTNLPWLLWKLGNYNTIDVYQQPHGKQILYLPRAESDVVQFLWEFPLSVSILFPIYASNLRIKNFLIDLSPAWNELSKSQHSCNYSAMDGTRLFSFCKNSTSWNFEWMADQDLVLVAF